MLCKMFSVWLWILSIIKECLEVPLYLFKSLFHSFLVSFLTISQEPISAISETAATLVPSLFCDREKKKQPQEAVKT